MTANGLPGPRQTVDSPFAPSISSRGAPREMSRRRGTGCPDSVTRRWIDGGRRVYAHHDPGIPLSSSLLVVLSLRGSAKVWPRGTVGKVRRGGRGVGSIGDAGTRIPKLIAGVYRHMDQIVNPNNDRPSQRADPPLRHNLRHRRRNHMRRTTQQIIDLRHPTPNERV
jgi:hypothetical protein